MERFGKSGGLFVFENLEEDAGVKSKRATNPLKVELMLRLSERHSHAAMIARKVMDDPMTNIAHTLFSNEDGARDAGCMM